MSITTLSIALCAIASDETAPPEVDLSRVERRIAKEPDYVVEPLYGLFILDEAGAFRCWAVFDKTTPGAKHYDVLHFDRDGDGDLTEPGERIVGKWNEAGAAAGLGMALVVGDVAVPGTSIVHTGLRISTSPKSDWKGFWFQMKWAGKTEMSGGYVPVGQDHTEYSPSIEDAPILWPCPRRPLTFALWEEDPVRLQIGGSNHLNVIAGVPGAGSGALAVVDENFIDLARDALIVTVIGRDASGNELTTESRIRGHC